MAGTAFVLIYVTFGLVFGYKKFQAMLAYGIIMTVSMLFSVPVKDMGALILGQVVPGYVPWMQGLGFWAWEGFKLIPVVFIFAGASMIGRLLRSLLDPFYVPVARS